SFRHRRACNPGAAGRKSVMKFTLTFAIRPESRGRDEAIARFKKTGGKPPKGAKLLGRWTAADFSSGFDLESDDVASLAEFSLVGSDIMELKLDPVIEDAQLDDVLQRMKRPQGTPRRRGRFNGHETRSRRHPADLARHNRVGGHGSAGGAAAHSR